MLDQRLVVLPLSAAAPRGRRGAPRRAPPHEQVPRAGLPLAGRERGADTGRELGVRGDACLDSSRDEVIVGGGGRGGGGGGGGGRRHGLEVEVERTRKESMPEWEKKNASALLLSLALASSSEASRGSDFCVALTEREVSRKSSEGVPRHAFLLSVSLARF